MQEYSQGYRLGLARRIRIRNVMAQMLKNEPAGQEADTGWDFSGSPVSFTKGLGPWPEGKKVFKCCSVSRFPKSHHRCFVVLFVKPAAVFSSH